MCDALLGGTEEGQLKINLDGLSKITKQACQLTDKPQNSPQRTHNCPY